MSSGEAFGFPSGLTDEPLSEVATLPIVEPPHVAVALERSREVRERLPRGHRIAVGGVLHRVEGGPLPAHVGERLRVEQDPLVPAEPFHGLPGDVHDLRRQRAALGEDRERGEDEHVGIRAEEHQLEEVLDRVADARVVLAAVLLRERLPEALAVQDRVQVVLEEMALHVEDELLAPERLVGARRLHRGARRDLVGAAGLARGRRRVRSVLLAGARVEGEERGGRTAGRQEELPAAHPQAPRVAFGVVASAADRLPQDQRQDGLRVVLGVRRRPEVDREPGILLVPILRPVLRRILRLPGPVHVASSGT
jgi:hypothetical protein